MLFLRLSAHTSNSYGAFMIQDNRKLCQIDREEERERQRERGRGGWEEERQRKER